ncbi:hypothetical protein Cni_G19949 [Canna indica]|uniref:Exocyst subunit Exo70 family protein n=1 Tax=Canna indica TaxID=4628 RepID=A0AAQ3KLI5_9LILI|nr:hypothetical protein Cni_G19949 [Canna indica]
MDDSKHRLLHKSSSFSISRDEKHRAINRNLSLGPIKLQQLVGDDLKEETDDAAEVEAGIAEQEPEPTLITISDDIDKFIGVILSDVDDHPSDIPESTIEKFVALVEEELAKYETGEEKWPSGGDEITLFDAIDRLSKLSSALSKFPSESKCYEAMNRSGSVLHQAMCFLEDGFHLLLQDPKAKQESGANIAKTRQLPSFHLPSFRLNNSEPDRNAQPPPPQVESNSGESPLPYPAPETVERLQKIAAVMISAGYDTECCQVFAIARRNAFETALTNLGYEKVSIDDVLKMSWDSLESEIVSYIKAFKHIMTASFTAEHELCEAVFAGHRAICDRLFRGFAQSAIIQLLAFAEAVSMTKRSAEKLLKVLDIYEALRDVKPNIDTLLPSEHEQDESSVLTDPKADMSSLQCRLGEAAVAIFCDLGNSIKADNNKTPVQGGAVHRLTRFVMKYLKDACEYKNTLEQLFKEHKHPEKPSTSDDDGENSQGGDRDSSNDERNLLGEQLVEALDLLHSNLDSKAKLYKDLALSNIFLLNNGRYIVKKVKISTEIHHLVGETWYRRRSSELQQYHKNYQRETWSKLVACLRDEGLQVKGGSVAKPVLKERFKSFNAMFEEIHKTQSTWVVSDEQLQSELRVSVSAVVVPAYRSFLGRFSQYLDPGRQTEKYIKFGAEDLENMIDELFDGNPFSSLPNPTKKRT